MGTAWLLLLITCLPWLRCTHWTVRVFDFPRFQIAAFGLAVCTGLAFFDVQAHSGYNDVALGAALFVVVVQAIQIWPYTRLAPKQMLRAQRADTHQISIINANVLMTNRNVTGLLDQVQRVRPHLLVTLESDAWWGEQLESALSEDYVHNVSIPLDNLYGMHLFSRLPLEDVEVRWLIQDDIPSIRCWVRLESGERIRLYALHPRPPSPSESDESLWRDAELLLAAEEIKQESVPTLLVGDLNDVAWSHTTRLFCNISGMLDPRRGRGTFSTFHARWPFLRWPLDHAFASSDFELVHLERLKYFGSDHFPLLVELMYCPAYDAAQETPHADKEQWNEAKQTITTAQDRARSDDGAASV